MLRIVAFVRSGEHPGETDGLSRRGELQIQNLAPELVQLFSEERVRPLIVYTSYKNTIYLGREETAFMLARAFGMERGDAHLLDSSAADQRVKELREIERMMGFCEGLIIVTSDEHATSLMRHMARPHFGRTLAIPELPYGHAHLLYPAKQKYRFLLPRDEVADEDFAQAVL